MRLNCIKKHCNSKTTESWWLYCFCPGVHRPHAMAKHHLYSRNANYRVSKGLHKLLEATGLISLIFTSPTVFFFFKLGLCMTFQKSRNFCERFTSQDIAVGVHQWMATYSVSCLFLSRSQPSCCPCCFFFLPRLKCWCLFLYLRSLGFNSKNLQSKCNYCLSCLCHWQLH